MLIEAARLLVYQTSHGYSGYAHLPKNACFLSTEEDCSRVSQSSEGDCGGYSIEVSGTTTFSTEEANKCSKDMLEIVCSFYALPDLEGAHSTDLSVTRPTRHVM